MEWLIKLPVLWIGCGIIVLATSWYISTVVKPRWPDWWQAHVVSDEMEPLGSQLLRTLNRRR